MQENPVSGSVSERQEMTPEEWAIAALKVAEQEIRRLQRLGYVPYTLNDDDLRSEANEILAGIVGAPEDHVRQALRCRLINCIKREFMKQRAQIPTEFLPGNKLPMVGALEFHQLISGLTAKQRQAVLLFFVSGETTESAAELLGISKQAFSKHIEKALGSIRKIFFQVVDEIPC